MKADPLEMHNLSEQPQHQTRIKNMMMVLDDWQKIVDDPLDLNEPEASYDAFLKLTWD